jgi:hypothetical protein
MARHRPVGHQLGRNRPDPSPEITAQTLELIAGAPDFYTKLSRITDYIQKNIRYFIVERGIGGWQAICRETSSAIATATAKTRPPCSSPCSRLPASRPYYLPRRQPPRHRRSRAPSLYGNHMITAIELPADNTDPRLVGHRQSGRQALPHLRPHQRAHPRRQLFPPTSKAATAPSPPAQTARSSMPVLPPDANGTNRKGPSPSPPTACSPARSITRGLFGDDGTDRAMVHQGE